METGVFRCAWCFEENELDIDISAGKDQIYVEDCRVCCRPNTIHVKLNDEAEVIDVTAEAEG
ncbi:MAG: CPXCG motif-containing cysteine-rich protein [Ignavibacteria bacterium]|nr:CPXCG motif-containing cysteine-rich protein [Ignavibacteria bacterium]